MPENTALPETATNAPVGGAILVEPQVLRTLLKRAYKRGFISASQWADRDDLVADTDSPAYKRERDGLLDQLQGSLPSATGA